ncbi:MAG: hypothetical protein M0021_12595 [Clostridia bacterium]|nr:hypothetical protein [Clostridia bacterium]
MSTEDKAVITFGSQMGDNKAAEAVQLHLIKLRKLLKKYCKEPYSDVINEFAPIARVDGEIWHWDFEGCQKLRLNRKERYITIDIGVPRNRWEGISPLEIRKYLIENLRQALILMVNKLKKEKIFVDEGRLFQDFAKVEQEYL